MGDKTLEALKGSIQKWEDIVAGTGYDNGVLNCPLCQMFFRANPEGVCRGCPVFERTSTVGCRGTPFTEWQNLFSDHDEMPFWAKTDEQKLAAKAELEFLKSLLPK